ncbi:MAG TPA: hypothetical protein VKZ79_22915 [Alphaproteobacteria bacterium]|nr:hypothetical protein [Alphaproteobacteria bacterium]
MIRITTLVWIALLVVAGGTVMRVSYQVRHVEKHLFEITRAAEQEQQAIRILGAEWDTLNDPKRIDRLSKRYLGLESTPIRRVVALDDVPLKPSPDQIAKLLAEQAEMKHGKSHAAQRTPAPVHAKPQAPTLEARANPPSVATPVASAEGAIELPRQGLVFARAERRE